MTRRMVLVCTLAAFAAIGLRAQGRWELLGQRNVTDRADHDIIVVTRAKGTFRSIKIEVRRRGVDFHRVVLHFANGGDQRVELRATIRAGGDSRVIDIEGGDRVIRSIDMWYDARSVGRGGSATVRVLGRH